MNRFLLVSQRAAGSYIQNHWAAVSKIKDVLSSYHRRDLFYKPKSCFSCSRDFLLSMTDCIMFFFCYSPNGLWDIELFCILWATKSISDVNMVDYLYFQEFIRVWLWLEWVIFSFWQPEIQPAVSLSAISKAKGEHHLLFMEMTKVNIIYGRENESMNECVPFVHCVVIMSHCRTSLSL